MDDVVALGSDSAMLTMEVGSSSTPETLVLVLVYPEILNEIRSANPVFPDGRNF